jgi:hypothetical protein
MTDPDVNHLLVLPREDKVKILERVGVDLKSDTVRKFRWTLWHGNDHIYLSTKELLAKPDACLNEGIMSYPAESWAAFRELFMKKMTADTADQPVVQTNSSFKITRGQGFHIVFENGYTVSVQFGYGHYCANRDNRFESAEIHSSPDAEVAIWKGDGGWYHMDDEQGEDVIPYVRPDRLTQILDHVSKLPKGT